MADTIDKVVATNLSALSEKYGTDLPAIQQALDHLIQADQARGVTTAVIGLDGAQAMAKLGAKPVTDASDPRQAKEAVDAIFAALNPAYLMLLGAIDIVPHQPLVNPLYPGDPDELAHGDLPYACDAPYSDQARDFIGPTRVVGRLPDVTCVPDPSCLVGELQSAAAWQPHPRDDYMHCLGISAAKFQGSTTLSLTNLFGSANDLRLSPAEGPLWASALLHRQTHFINCHGAESDCHYYGQLGDSYPVVHDTQDIQGHLQPGTVVAAECCYGAQLYDPTAVGGVAGICNTYLADGAFGFFGSSTIAYGPDEGNGAADLLCQYFLRSVLQGASLGRAALQARQEFVGGRTVVEPQDLKTLAQFSLMGDPSIHPVLPQSDLVPVAADSMQKGLPSVALQLLKGRTSRRSSLAATGSALLQSKAVAATSVEVRDAQLTISKVMEAVGVSATEISGEQAPVLLSFEISAPSLAGAKFLAPPKPALIHVVARRGHEATPVLAIELLVAREVAGQITSYRRLFAK
jgi:hypothetical protein